MSNTLNRVQHMWHFNYGNATKMNITVTYSSTRTKLHYCTTRFSTPLMYVNTIPLTVQQVCYGKSVATWRIYPHQQEPKTPAEISIVH